MMAEDRLQKLIARSGLCSRREADRMIRDGRVTLNGRVAQLGDRADLGHDHVKVDGKRLKAPEALRYILMYKPREVMTTCDDPEERTTVIDLLRSSVKERVFPVGRLDYQSEGLIVITNDGELAARLGHPRYGVVREYLVKVRGDLDDDEHRRLMRGTTIGRQHVRPLSARRQSGTRGGNSWWRIEITEGRTHEVRELFFRAGHRVQRLRRTAIGPIRDGELRPGEFRPLADREIQGLREATARPTARKRQSAPAKSHPRRAKRSNRRDS
jgi:pseudouridine synthase